MRKQLLGSSAFQGIRLLQKLVQAEAFMKVKRRYVPTFLGLIMLSLALSGCNLSLYERYELGVPFEWQEQSDYCVPASVLMWRLFDGLPRVSQSSIYNWLGGRPCNALDVPSAVNHFTNTFDAYLDIEFSPSSDERDQLVARQIVAEDRGTPVIAIVGPARNHVGVIDGGKYKKQQGSYYVWEFLFFHDPARGEGLYYTSSDWMEEFCGGGFSHCGQILSNNAITGWTNYYATYRNSIFLYGGDGNPCIGSCGPYEN